MYSERIYNDFVSSIKKDRYNAKQKPIEITLPQIAIGKK